MKLVCPLSAVEWQAEGFATGHKKLIMPHPIFSAPLSNLFARYSTDWHADKLSDEEKVLLFLALLKASEKVTFLVPATPSLSVVETNIENLAKAIAWITSLRIPATAIPSFAISKQTQNLDNVTYWIKAWEAARVDFEQGQRIRIREEIKSKLEYVLEKSIARIEAGITKESPAFLERMATWASIATNFPTCAVSHPITGAEIQLDAYWRELIQAPESKWYSYPLNDWKELEDHFIDNLEDLDSMLGLAMVKKLRKVITHTTADLGLIVIEIPTLGMDQSTSDAPTKKSYTYATVAGDKAAMERIASNAPSSEPRPEDFTSRALYLQAKVAFNMAKALGNLAPVVSEAPKEPEAPKVEDL